MGDGRQSRKHDAAVGRQLALQNESSQYMGPQPIDGGGGEISVVGDWMQLRTALFETGDVAV